MKYCARVIENSSHCAKQAISQTRSSKIDHFKYLSNLVKMD